MTVPDTPPAEFADLSPEAWARYVATVDGRARRVFQALADGERPLRAGEVAQLRTLTAGLRSAYGLTLNEAQAAAWQMGALTPRLAATLGSTLGAVPGHVTQAVAGMNGWLAAQGFQTVGLPAPTLAFLVNRTQQAITSDWTRLAADLQDRIVTGLQYAVTAGQSIPDTVRALRVGFADTAGWTAARATNVARTEIADVMHATARESMQAAGAEAWMWDATEDARTCEICLTMHGRVFPMSEPMDSHQMCRCAQVPVFGDELDRVTGDPVGGDLGYMGGVRRYSGGVDRARLVKTDNPGWRPSWKVAQAARVADSSLPAALQVGRAESPARDAWLAARLSARELSRAEQRVYDGYRAHDYHQINGGLRNPKEFNGYSDWPRLKQRITTMRNIVRRSVTQAPLTLWRGVDLTRADPALARRLARLKPGDVLRDKGFVSTSADRTVAEKFAYATSDQTPVMLQIEAPRGVQAMLGAEYEAEVVLQAGTALRITGRTVETIRNVPTIVYRAEVVT